MFYWIIWALLSSIWDITYKKSVIISWKKLSNFSYQFIRWFFSSLISFVIYWIFIYISWVNFWIISFVTFFLFIIIWLLTLFENIMYAYAYKNEKISVLSPYQQIDTILTVIFWFIFFSWVSIFSFIFVVVAWIVLILWSLDLKKFKFNKYAITVIIACIFASIKTNILAYVLLYLNPFDTILYTNIFAFFIAFITIYIKKQVNYSIIHLNKKILLFLNIESLIRILIWLIYAYLVSETWVVQATLLWLLTIFSNMIFAYFVFKEIPAKKDLWVAFVVIVCIILWTIL